MFLCDLLTYTRLCITSLLDPNTKQWLRESLDPMFGYPTIVRFSWSTCQEKLDSKALPIQWLDLH